MKRHESVLIILHARLSTRLTMKPSNTTHTGLVVVLVLASLYLVSVSLYIVVQQRKTGGPWSLVCFQSCCCCCLFVHRRIGSGDSGADASYSAAPHESSHISGDGGGGGGYQST